MAKAPLDIRSLARNHTDEAISKLAQWMRSDNAKASVAAAIALIDRGWGKAEAVIKSDVTHRYVARMPSKAPSVDEWQNQHSPETTH